MKEIIEAQFKSGKSLTQSKYHGYINRENFPKYMHEFYPIAEEYYHELNPYFLCNYYQNHFFNFSKMTTVRDGYLGLANFLLKNYRNLSKLEPGLFLIHPDLVPLIPPNMSHYFGTWNIVQRNQVSLPNAKKIIIFGLVSNEYLGTEESLEKRLQPLKNINPDATIEVLLPLRRNVFEKANKENYLAHNTVTLIKDTLKDREFRFILTKDFIEFSNFRNTFCFDLKADRMLVSDSYIDHHVLGRGGSTNNQILTDVPKDSVFSLELSPHHELHVSPLSDIKRTIFPDILLSSKLSRIDDYLYSLDIQAMLRNLLSKENGA